MASHLVIDEINFADENPSNQCWWYDYRGSWVMSMVQSLLEHDVLLAEQGHVRAKVGDWGQTPTLRRDRNGGALRLVWDWSFDPGQWDAMRPWLEAEQERLRQNR